MKYLINSLLAIALAAGTAFAGAPITRWATTNNMSVTDTVHVGLVAYCSEGIDRIEFSVDNGTVTTVTAETMNPDHNEIEYVYTVAAAGLSAAAHTVQATVYPGTGAAVVMDDLDLDVVHGIAFNVITANPSGGADHTTLQAAMDAASGGDTIRLATGEYTLPASWQGIYNRYVTVMPADGATPAITDGPVNVTEGYVKFVNILFDASQRANTVNVFKSDKVGNFWFKDCTFRGIGVEAYDNKQTCFRLTKLSTNNTIEGCDISGITRIFVVDKNSIMRNNHIYDVPGDIWNPGKGMVLVTGNHIHDVKSPYLFVEAATAGPYDFSVNKELVVNHCGETHTCDSASYAVYTVPDLSEGAVDPAAVTVDEAVLALSRNSAFNNKCWAEARDGKLRIYSRRHNLVQQMWVTGAANDILGIAANSLANEVEGSGIHADIFQSYGHAGVIDTVRDMIFRNNLSHDNLAQGIFVGQRCHNMNFAFVNNLVDKVGKDGWCASFTDSPDEGETYENVLFEHNTIWDGGSTILFYFHDDVTDIVFRNNAFGRANQGKGDIITTAGSDMDYNFYYGYNNIGPTVNTNSIYEKVIIISPIDVFADVTFEFSNKDDSGDFRPAATSPAVDAGSSESGITYDLNWHPRDASPDMGCFEYGTPSDIGMPDAGLKLHEMLMLPNPISLAQLRSLDAGVRVLGLTGGAVDVRRLTDGGVYYLQIPGQVGPVKIIVVK